MRGPGIALDFGAARVRVLSTVPDLAGALRTVYGMFEPEPSEGVFDATVSLRRVCGVRSLVAPQVELIADGARLFEPFPAATHLPLLEWGLNYLIAARTNQHLLLHAGAVEQGGVGVLLPALPGSGKSTLTAALVCHGYRLLSDEFGVIDLLDGSLRPLVRPIGLKNASIGIIEAMAPDVRLGPRFEGTRKGTVAHLAPGRRSVRMRHVAATPGLILFPRFEPGAQTRIEDVDPARAISKLSINAFNHRLLGPAGFDAVLKLVRDCGAQQLVYGSLGEAIRQVDALVSARRSPLQKTGT